MGRSTLPKGAIIEVREQGEYVLYQITKPKSTWHSGVCEDTIPAGTPIHRCVWKGDNLEVRKIRTKLTPATKTVAQWEAECKAFMEDQMRSQQDYMKRFDAVCATCDPNDPVAIMTTLLRAALDGKL